MTRSDDPRRFLKSAVLVVMLCAAIFMFTAAPGHTAGGLAPVTTAKASPPPNKQGWNTTTVTVSLRAVAKSPGATVRQITYITVICNEIGCNTYTAIVPGGEASVWVTNRGQTTVTFFAEDSEGRIEEAKSLVVSFETDAPTISGLSPQTPLLWPPDGTMRDVQINYAMFDYSPTVCKLGMVRDKTQAISQKDFQILDDHHLRLRAERNPDGSERVYTIGVTCTNKISRSSTAQTTVTVRFDYATAIRNCIDTDGDGFCDEWEIAGGIDLNWDGRIDGEHDCLLPNADPNRPDIYVQYDYMGWGPPGPSCSTDTDCHTLGRVNEVCHEGHCNHNHKPLDPTFQTVVDAFADHGINLHIDPVHQEIPHSQVVTWQSATDPFVAYCAGAVPGPPGSYAVNFHDMKARYFHPKRVFAYHYAIFGHYTTCDSQDHCRACSSDRASPPGNFIPFGASGLAEMPGNDFMVTLGDMFYGPYPINRTDYPLVELGTFMHELGHNLGLHHNGDIADTNYSPNYMSVMNYKYTYGIMTSLEVGSNMPDGPTRLDFSNSALPVVLHEIALNEADGVAPLSSGNRDIVYFYNGTTGDFTFGAGAGPIDWSGNGLIDQQPVTVDLNGGCGIDSGGSPYCDTYRGYADWVHGPCTTSEDCPVNNVLTFMNGGKRTHEPCHGGRCQSLIYNFQETPWGLADGPAPSGHRISCISAHEARQHHVLFPPLVVTVEARRSAATGAIEVTLFGSDKLDVKEIDQPSVKFSGSKPLNVEIRDVDGDGRTDLVAHFDEKGLNLMAKAGRLTLTGTLKSSQVFVGGIQVHEIH